MSQGLTLRLVPIPKWDSCLFSTSLSGLHSPSRHALKSSKCGMPSTRPPRIRKACFHCSSGSVCKLCWQGSDTVLLGWYIPCSINGPNNEIVSTCYPDVIIITKTESLNRHTIMISKYNFSCVIRYSVDRLHFPYSEPGFESRLSTILASCFCGIKVILFVIESKSCLP